jgi:hypothetical protein
VLYALILANLASKDVSLCCILTSSSDGGVANSKRFSCADAPFRVQSNHEPAAGQKRSLTNLVLDLHLEAVPFGAYSICRWNFPLVHVQPVAVKSFTSHLHFLINKAME